MLLARDRTTAVSLVLVEIHTSQQVPIHLSVGEKQSLKELAEPTTSSLNYPLHDSLSAQLVVQKRITLNEDMQTSFRDF